MVCSFRYALRKWDNHLIFIYEKLGKADTAGRYPSRISCLTRFRFSFRVVRRIDQLHNRVRRLPFRRCHFASLRLYFLPLKRKEKACITSLSCLRENVRRPRLRRKLRADIIIAHEARQGVLTRHRNDIRGCHWQMKQGACPLSQLQTREVKLH